MKERIKRAAKDAAARAAGPAPKQVKLKLVHIDFWSAVRVGFLCTVAIGVAILVASFLSWVVASQAGVFGSINNLLNGASGSGTLDVGSTLSLPRVMSFALALAFIQMVAGTLLSGVTALIFNVIGRITGGVSVGFTSNN
ncbi:MAG: DUF3566 domain-containing protein [Actinomycetales bacterium]|nr:DUF3566 domain-containing protein [Actinomycetales bacterium]